MPSAPTASPATPLVSAHCRCGHLPTHHMQVRPAPGGNFRLLPVGPCTLCGEASCRSFTPGPPA